MTINQARHSKLPTSSNLITSRTYIRWKREKRQHAIFAENTVIRKNVWRPSQIYNSAYIVSDSPKALRWLWFWSRQRGSARLSFLYTRCLNNGPGAASSPDTSQPASAALMPPRHQFILMRARASEFIHENARLCAGERFVVAAERAFVYAILDEDKKFCAARPGRVIIGLGGVGGIEAGDCCYYWKKKII